MLCFSACTRPPLTSIENVTRAAKAPKLADDLPLEPLLSAVSLQAEELLKRPGHQKFIFGDRVYTKEQYVAGLRRFVELGRSSASTEAFLKSVADEFDFFEVNGEKGWGDAFISSYYEPILEGSLRKSAKFNQPLYKTPEDLVSLDLVPFDEKYSLDRKLRGRLVERKLVPYFSREEIDGQGALAKRKLELCWVDPLDAFFLQVQGSGTIHLTGGKSLRLGYAEKNGHRYESIGQFLKDVLPPEKISLQTIERHLRTLSEEEMRRILNLNPSYVFFQELEKNAITSFGVPATDGRTVATDGRFFQKGTLAFLSSTKPVFDSAEAIEPAEWIPFSRFVVDQDIGGGIKGGGRLDLFWGSGPEAKRFAGVMKQPGRLYYLAPKHYLNSAK